MYFFISGGRRFAPLLLLVGEGGTALPVLDGALALEMERPSIRFGSCWDMAGR
jgi:hypothetical protein